MKPTISLVILAHNKAEHTARCLDAAESARRADLLRLGARSAVAQKVQSACGFLLRRGVDGAQ